jgi:hypothetical protein
LLKKWQMAATHKCSVISIAVNETTRGDTNYEINNKKFWIKSNLQELAEEIGAVEQDARHVFSGE